MVKVEGWTTTRKVHGYISNLGRFELVVQSWWISECLAFAAMSLGLKWQYYTHSCPVVQGISNFSVPKIELRISYMRTMGSTTCALYLAVNLIILKNPHVTCWQTLVWSFEKCFIKQFHWIYLWQVMQVGLTSNNWVKA